MHNKSSRKVQTLPNETGHINKTVLLKIINNAEKGRSEVILHLVIDGIASAFDYRPTSVWQAFN